MNQIVAYKLLLICFSVLALITFISAGVSDSILLYYITAINMTFAVAAYFLVVLTKEDHAIKVIKQNIASIIIIFLIFIWVFGTVSMLSVQMNILSIQRLTCFSGVSGIPIQVEFLMGYAGCWFKYGS